MVAVRLPEPRRSADRSVTRRAGVVTRHTFSFGAHYDPAATGVGPLVAVNEERLEPGSGYDEHRHAGLDVVSWVGAGTVAHSDPVTGRRLVPAGSVGVLRSGLGVVHAERCPAGEPGRALLVQSWLAAARTGSPRYDVADVSGLLPGGGLVPVASGAGGPDAPLALTVAGAVLRVARLAPTEGCALPVVGLGWLHVVAGELALTAGLRLAAGDGLALGGGTGGALVGGAYGAEVLLWEVPEGP